MKLVLPAYAKLNLTLDVLSRQADGYHQIASIMQTISLHDLLEVEAASETGFESIGLQVTGDNLVLEALRLLESEVGRRLPLRVRLHKRIAVGAGLGGGSADAATLLRGAARLYRLGITDPALAAVAAAAGQDVPFFLRGGTALATGLGADIERLPALPPTWTFLVYTPPIMVSTERVYAGVDGAQPSAGRTPAAVEALRAGRPLPADAFGNDLETAARKAYPELDAAAARLRELAPGAAMTGSGGAFFVGFARPDTAQAAHAALRQSGLHLQLCRPVRSWEG